MQPIVACGIPRSGSTLVWQILQAVFPQNIIPKIHPGCSYIANSSVLLSIRQPHDVVASMYRVRLSRAGVCEGTHADVETVIADIEKSFTLMNAFLLGHNVLIRYEDFYKDYTLIYNAIYMLTGVDVPREARKAINEKYSLEANRKRAAVLDNFNEFDTDQIHGDHIGAVVPSYWRGTLPKGSWDEVATVCNHIAEMWGYENQY